MAGAAPAPVNVPQLVGGWPLVGHARDFVLDPIALLQRVRDDLGPVGGFRLGPQRAVLLSGPEAHEAFFRAPDSEVSQRDAYQLMIPVFGRGVVYDASPERMIEQFHFLIPAFQDRRMSTYSELIAAETHDATAGWMAEGVIETYAFTKSLVSHTSTGCLLGPEFRTQLTAQFEAAYADLEGGVKPIAYVAPNLPIPAFRRRDRARTHLEHLIGTVIQARRTSGDQHDDFLQTLIEAQYQDGTAPSDHEITGLLLAALFAGRDTSSATAAWTLIELARHPDIQSQVAAELAAARSSFTADRGDEHVISAVPLLDYVIKEVLRLHPPLFILLRRLLEPMNVNGVTIDKGALIAVSPRIAHRDPVIFVDPNAFDPQRFGPGRDEGKQAFAYIPFGGGRHRCLGSGFAMLQLRLIVALILRDYELEALDDSIEEAYGALVVGPKRPARIRYRRRRRH